MEESMEVIIILVNFNGWNDTIECIESVLLSNFKAYKVLVVDNCSSDNSFTEFEKWCNNKGNNKKFESHILWSPDQLENDNDWKVSFIKHNENKGFAAGNNVGLNFAEIHKLKYKYVWYLNNDTVIEIDTLKCFVQRMDEEIARNTKIGILGGKLLFYSHRDIFQGVGGMYNKLLANCNTIGRNEIDNGQFDIDDVNCDYIIGASMFVRKDFLDEVGLMREDYFLYFEELDWVNRGEKLGWGIGYDYRAKVYHKEGNTTKYKKGISKIADGYQVRNRIVFTSRYFTPYLISVIPIVFGSVINRVLRGNIKRAFYIFFVIIKTLKEIISKKV